MTFTGPVLKKIREGLGIPLQSIFQTTKVRVEQLEAIEAESFDKLPDEAYLRAQLKEYAGHLLLNPRKVIADYLKFIPELLIKLGPAWPIILVKNIFNRPDWIFTNPIL